MHFLDLFLLGIFPVIKQITDGALRQIYLQISRLSRLRMYSINLSVASRWPRTSPYVSLLHSAVLQSLKLLVSYPPDPP